MKTQLEILDFTLMNSKDGNESVYATAITLIRINLDDDHFVMASVSQLSEINEEIYSFIREPFYYHAEIVDVIAEFIETGDYKIEKEA